MKKIIAFFLLVLLACSQIENGSIAYKITEKDLIMEGITFSETNHSFYVSSIFKQKIIRVDAKTGEFSDFSEADSMAMRYLGMIVDEEHGHLWACGNLKKDDVYYSAIVKFDLQNGAVLKSWMHTDTTSNIYNDLVMDKAGNVYFTNTNASSVSKIDNQTDSVSVFLAGNDIIHPNGITISPDNQYLYVASQEMGIRIIDIEQRRIINGPAGAINSTGLDGIKFFHNSIIGIQNEVKSRDEMKIAQYMLDESGTEIVEMRVIDQNNPYFDIPTTLVITDNTLYCLANSQMGNLNWQNYKILSYEALDDNLILQYKLKN